METTSSPDHRPDRVRELDEGSGEYGFSASQIEDSIQHFYNPARSYLAWNTIIPIRTLQVAMRECQRMLEVSPILARSD